MTSWIFRNHLSNVEHVGSMQYITGFISNSFSSIHGTYCGRSFLAIMQLVVLNDHWHLLFTFISTIHLIDILHLLRKLTYKIHICTRFFTCNLDISNHFYTLFMHHLRAYFLCNLIVEFNLIEVPVHWGNHIATSSWSLLPKANRVPVVDRWSFNIHLFCYFQILLVLLVYLYISLVMKLNFVD